MKKKDVLVIGELNVDLLLNNIQGFPVIGEEILAGNMVLAMGSSSAIFASNISSLGARTSFCGMLGQDLLGRFVLEELQKRKVDTSLIIESPKYKTGATVVLNYAQDRANVTYCGAMEVFNGDSIPYAQLEGFRHLHFSSYFLQKGMQAEIIHLFKTAREKGLTTSLDIQWDPDNRWDFPYEQCLPYVDIFLPNESELLSLAGENELMKALEIIGRHANAIVVKRGTMGAFAYQDGQITDAAPFLHEQFADAIGAGDSFNAGFILKYLAGSTLTQSLEFANLAGAINTTGFGGTAAFDGPESFAEKVKKVFNIII